jgi:hypothetical protein
VTTLAILLPSQDYRIAGQVVTSKFMIILAAMILWGICEGYGCEVQRHPVSLAETNDH